MLQKGVTFVAYERLTVVEWRSCVAAPNDARLCKDISFGYVLSRDKCGPAERMCRRHIHTSIYMRRHRTDRDEGLIVSASSQSL